MMIAFVVPGRGGRDVARAKNAMSAFMRGQGEGAVQADAEAGGEVFACADWGRGDDEG